LGYGAICSFRSGLSREICRSFQLNGKKRIQVAAKSQGRMREKKKERKKMKKALLTKMKMKV